jgi:hypothetical protein
VSIPETVKTEIAKALGLKSPGLAVELRPPLDFQSNRLYDIRADGYHFIAKQYLQAGEIEEAPLREFKALKLLSHLDIAPQPIFFEPSLAPIVIYEYMPGEMWDRRPPASSDLLKLVQVWLKINSVSADWLSHGSERPLPGLELEFQRDLSAYYDWVSAEFKSGERASEICLELLESRRAVVCELSEHTPDLCFCRADPRFANVIQRPNGQLGLVDWEDSGLRDPARELADILTHPNQEDLLNWEEWQIFIEPYLDVRSRIDRDIAVRMHLYLAIFPIFWLTFIIKQGLIVMDGEQPANWAINGLPGNQRLRRYLARGLAWPDMDYGNALDKLGDLAFFPR